MAHAKGRLDLADSLNIPGNQQDITAEWVQRALALGTGSDVPKIRGVAIEEIGAGIGMVGRILRCHLTYEGEPLAALRTIVIKLPSVDDNTRQTARQLRLYQREFDFYRALASHVPIQAPRLLYGDFYAGDHNFVLVLEDLGHMATVDQVDGASEQQAMVAIRAAARMHGRYWGQVDLPPVSTVYVPTTPERHSMVQAVYQLSLPRVFELFGDHFSAAMRRLAESYGSHLAEHSAVVARRPQTLIHGDFRLDNMFFDPDEHGDVAVVDWQVSGVGSALYDVAYFLSSSVATDIRRAIERDAIETYHDVVNSVLTGGPTLDECWRSYREAMLTCFRTPIIAGGQLDFSNDRGRRLAEVFLERTLTAIDDLDAGEFLPAES